MVPSTEHNGSILEFNTAVWTCLIYAVICAVLVTLAIGSTHLHHHVSWMRTWVGHAIGWPLAVAFAGELLGWLWRIVRANPQVVITDAGLHDRRSGLVIEWRDVKWMWLHGGLQLCFEVTDPERYLTNYTWPHRVYARVGHISKGTLLVVRMGYLTPSVKQLAGYLRTCHSSIFSEVTSHRRLLRD